MSKQADLELDLRPGVPAAVLRITAGLAAGPAVLIVGVQGWRAATSPSGLWDGVGSPELAGWSIFFGLAAAAWLVWRTQDHVAPVLSIGIGLGALATDGGVSWRTFVLAGLVLVMLRASALVGGLAWSARIELDVLRPVLRSTGAVLLAVVTVGAVVGLLDGASDADAGMKVLGSLAVIVVAMWLLPKQWMRAKARDR